MKTLPAALYPWFFVRQFIVVRIDAPRAAGEKNIKTPVSYLTGRGASAQDSANQTDFSSASAAAAIMGPSHAVGFTFTADDDYFFVDIDNCLVNGEWTPMAQDVMARFPGAAVEVSNSGKGLHIFGKGKSPAHKCKNTALDLEYYTEQRFVLLTGTSISGNAGTRHDAALEAFVQDYMRIDEHVAGMEWTDAPCKEWSGPEDDDALLSVALSRVSPAAAFGSKASFRDLYEANVDALSKHYPHDSKDWDYSSADSALAYHLAYWTGRDCERMERIMKTSPLARDKWAREDYLQGTIIKAAAGTKDVYMRTPVAAAAAAHNAAQPGTPVGEMPVIEEHVFYDGFENHFKGCSLAVIPHKMFSPQYGLLSPEQVRSSFGSKLFVMDAGNEKTTKDAWEALTTTRCGWSVPRVDNVAYRPDLDHGEVFNWEDGKKYVNTFKPHSPRRMKGDMSLFTTHMKKLVPDERDRTILISYMAAITQYPGKKFTWCPVIQGAPGNGKTTLSRCVEYAVGKQHSHWPRSDQISEKFNSWLFDKVFIGVDDIFVGRDKSEMMEILKPMVTGESLSKRAMNQDSITAPICCNFMLTTNHKDAIPKDISDRRFAVFFTAQQSVGDIMRDGMGGDYFTSLHTWLNKDGFAIVADFLLTYEIPDEFDPTGACNREPGTTSTTEAVSLTLGQDSDVIHEAIDSGELGFKGNFVSSKYFADYAKAKGLRVPLKKYSGLIKSLGYVPHPAFEDGRVTRVLQPDGIKSRLYVLEGSPEFLEMHKDVVMKMYTAAQLDLTT